MFPPEIKKAIQNQFSDKQTIEEYFDRVRSMYTQRIQEYQEIMDDDFKPSELRKLSFLMQNILKESLKVSEVMELSFLNNAETQNQIKKLSKIIAEIDIESDDVRREIQNIQEEIQQKEESFKENKSILTKFPFTMSGFDIDLGIFKGKFERKK